MEQSLGLCNRCEHRIRFLETGHGARCECGSSFLMDNEHLARQLEGMKEEKDQSVTLNYVIGRLKEFKRPQSVHSCYMYTPVEPFAIEPANGEKRDILGPAMIAGRAKASFLPSVKFTEEGEGQVALSVFDVGGKLFKTWLPVDFGKKALKMMKRVTKKVTKKVAKKKT